MTVALHVVMCVSFLSPYPSGVNVVRSRPAVRAVTPSMGAAPEKAFRPSTKPDRSKKQVRSTNQDRSSKTDAAKGEARPQQQPKAMVDRFDLQFTCNLCDTRNEHSISRHAYTKGTVIVTCPGCNATHLVADNLNWIEDDFVNLEEFMAKQGKPVTRIAKDGVAAAAAAAVAPVPVEEPEATSATAGKNIDGISDDQAARIRDAVRRNKRRNRAD
eukprot:CAMPEP_0119071934 /NCGR_PEP_ID=MMETSP1178-20130426/55780_1 /TAXON_ID=33656 /ORGANISM="unid sp, Strain CCMP2000" /LENGTH=214 /DNA_ID=CAMNT_0007053901 /DNA_START=45 /DNA_END=689 /DNA_ORIENTATION=+